MSVTIIYVFLFLGLSSIVCAGQRIGGKGYAMYVSHPSQLVHFDCHFNGQHYISGGSH